MTRNETIYVEELAAVFSTIPHATGTPQLIATTTQPVAVTTSTPLTATTTKQPTATTTKTVKKTKTATSTPVTVTQPEVVVAPLAAQTESNFSDLTLANQNMRVYKKDATTIVYAFVGDKNVLIANSPEGILALKSVILRK
jgi:hypothetical protein